MKLKLCVLMLLALVALVALPGNAQVITFANPNGIAERDFAIYNWSGQMIGLYNSTSTLTLNGSEDYIISMVPVKTNPMDDPTAWLTTNAFPFVSSNLMGIIAIVFLLALYFGRR